MGVIERRERERQEMRSRIMDAARDLFAREGYDAVSMRRIAEAIEYSPTAIYVHFRDKQDLMFQICQQDFVALAGGIADLQQVADPVERIRKMGEAYVWFGVTHPNHYRLMFMTKVDLPPDAVERDPNHGNVDRDSYALLRHTCQQAIDAGRVRPEYADADTLAQLFWIAVHGVTALHITKADNPWIQWKGIERLSKAAIDAILRGATTEAEHLPPSPGTPGEGRGEGLQSEISDLESQMKNPHPNPLPEYREREQGGQRATKGGRS